MYTFCILKLDATTTLIHVYQLNSKCASYKQPQKVQPEIASYKYDLKITSFTLTNHTLYDCLNATNYTKIRRKQLTTTAKLVLPKKLPFSPVSSRSILLSLYWSPFRATLFVAVRSWLTSNLADTHVLMNKFTYNHYLTQEY